MLADFFVEEFVLFIFFIFHKICKDAEVNLVRGLYEMRNYLLCVLCDPFFILKVKGKENAKMREKKNAKNREKEKKEKR
jgi:hypothetical protein